MEANEFQYLYRLRLKRPALLAEGPTTDESRALEQHVAYLSDLAGEGRVLLAGRTQTTGPDSFGIVIIADTTEDRALEIMHNDPAVRHEVMTAELFPFRIAMLSEAIREGG